MDNQWVWLANFDREENCCCRRRANSFRCACAKRAAKLPSSQGTHLCPRCHQAPVTDMFDEWCRRCESQAEKMLKDTQGYVYPSSVFSPTELALAEHARTRLHKIAEYDNWFADQKLKWAAEKIQKDKDYRSQYLGDPPPPGSDEVPATVLGQVVSSGVAEGTDFDLGPPPGLAAASSNANARAGGRRGNVRLAVAAAAVAKAPPGALRGSGQTYD